MVKDRIEAIGIDERGSLWLKPASQKFPYIYREAMEVGWDAERACLYGPPPRQRSYLDWFDQIRRAAGKQGVELELTPDTSWFGIEPDLRRAILQA